MKKCFEGIILTVWLLGACSPVPESSPTAVLATNPIVATTAPPASPTPAPTRIPQNTLTPQLTFKPRVTRTPPPIPVSNFDPNTVVRPTPAPPAQCPPKDLGFQLPKPTELPGAGDGAFELGAKVAFERKILELLNIVGAERVYKEYFVPEKRLEEYYSEFGLRYIDLTNDDVPELIIRSKVAPGSNFFIFGCANGKYKTLLMDSGDIDGAPAIIFAGDMNLNGVSDIAIEHTTCHYCTGVRVYEWDGQQFQSLARRWMFDETTNEWVGYDLAELDGYTQTSVQDIDGNGTLEIILDGGQPSWLGAIAGGEGPYREQTVVYGWDGQYFVWQSQEYRPANFRFEAVQDGDTATKRGNFDRALNLYQAVIFSDTLKSWTSEVWFKMVRESAEQGAINYPDANLMPFNQTEYDQLAAYARYRIMLLHAARGLNSDAKTVYDSLQNKFPKENAGHPYAEMAQAFWESYQTDQNLKLACAQAIAYAEKHDEILEPLGNGDQGLFSKFYYPKDVCPFGD